MGNFTEHLPIGSGGGAGIGIDEMVLLQTTAANYTAPDGSVYIRSGVVERTTSKYPDALVRNDGSDYVGSKLTYNIQDSASNTLYYYVRVK